jgi:hypothetical protein
MGFNKGEKANLSISGTEIRKLPRGHENQRIKPLKDNKIFFSIFIELIIKSFMKKQFPSPCDGGGLGWG